MWLLRLNDMFFKTDFLFFRNLSMRITHHLVFKRAGALRKEKRAVASPFVLHYVFLLFECANESDNAVDSKKDTYDEDHNVESVTEREQETNNNCKYGEHEIKRILVLILKRVDKSNYTLNCDKNTENEKHDLSCEPTENEYCNTDDKADSTAGVVLLDEVKNTGNYEENTRDSHCPTNCLGTEDHEKQTDNYVQNSGKEFGIFLCYHNNSPFVFDLCVNYTILCRVLQVRVKIFSGILGTNKTICFRIYFPLRSIFGGIYADRPRFP